MGSVQGYNDICNKCGHSSESYDYYYRTGEGWRYCAACGSYHSGLMRKTYSSYIQNNTICPLDGSYVIGISLLLPWLDISIFNGLPICLVFPHATDIFSCAGFKSRVCCFQYLIYDFGI